MSKEKQERSVREELEALAPGLSRLRAQEMFPEPPVGYFDRLPDEVWQRIRREDVREASGSAAFWSRVRRLKPAPGFRSVAYAAAATIAILLISLALFTGRQHAGGTEELSLSASDINEYIEYHIDDFDLRLLAEEAAGDEEEELLKAEDSLRDGAIENYLDEIIDDLELEELL